MRVLDLSESLAEVAAYAGLFLVAFAAATLLPAQSEAALVVLLMADYSPWLLLSVASIGNILGSTVNWTIGRAMHSFASRGEMPRTAASLQVAKEWYRRYGRWSLLLSWLPIVGDPLTVVAGLFRESLPVFLMLVTIAKVGRYLALTAATLWLS
jgi:membrane protein YqaA with SNARE-associated domain